jgi:hypothetical protein
MTILNAKKFTENVSNERCTEHEFKKIAMEFCEALKVVGIQMLPFHTSFSLHFSKRSKKAQKKILAYLDINLEILNECILSGENAFDNKVLLWRVFKRIGGAPQDDIFDKISDDDLVEVYFPDHTPLFRNLKFYREFSYTVDQALCQTWYQASSRDLIITFKVMKFALMFMRNAKKTVAWSIPAHYVDEKGTSMLYRALVRLKFLSGVHSGGELKAMICTSEANVVGANGKLY